MLSYLSLVRWGEVEMEQRKSTEVGRHNQSGFHEFWKPSTRLVAGGGLRLSGHLSLMTTTFRTGLSNHTTNDKRDAYCPKEQPRSFQFLQSPPGSKLVQPPS